MITDIKVDCGAQLAGHSALTKLVEVNYPDPVIDGNIDLTPTFVYTAAVSDDYDPSEYCPPIDCTHIGYTDSTMLPSYLSIQQNTLVLDDRALVEGNFEPAHDAFITLDITIETVCVSDAIIQSIRQIDY